MGPKGRNVIIENPGGYPVLTKDGVTVARNINLKDKFSNLGVQVLKEAASRTADEAGDGTTTATVLSQSIFLEGIKMLAAGYDPAEIKKGIDIAVKEVVENLKSLSIPITKREEMEQVATISANGETNIGTLIVDGIESVGRDGVVTVEEAKGFSTTLSVTDGLQFDRGYISPYFITNQDKMIAELDRPLILICNRKLTNLKELMSILEKVLQTGRPLLIVADDVEGEAMQGLVLNSARGALKVCAVKSPLFGNNRVDMLGDLACLLETRTLSSGENMDQIKIEDLGTCKKVLVSRGETVLIGCDAQSEKVQSRIRSLREKIDHSGTSEKERAILLHRLSKLSGGVAILRVGGSTEAELRERKDRVDDSLSATKAAIQEGIVPGGGVALIRASSKVSCPKKLLHTGVGAGIEIVKRACTEPFRQIILNSGGTPDVALEKVTDTPDTSGYDAYTSTYGDMFEMGIIDPVKVVRCALQNAASSSSMLLTVGCAMVEDEYLSD